MTFLLLISLYFQEASLRSDVLDEENGKKYWEICETLVKLQPNDPRI